MNIPSPRAPSIIAVNKKTGKLVWEDNSVGDRILHGQWSSPVGRQDRRRGAGRHAAQGDGWVRGYEATDRQEALGVRHQPQRFGLAEDAQRSDRDAGDLREQGLHRQRPGSGARRRRRPPLRDRRDQARRHHADRAALALRQDPPLDLDRRDLRRPAVLFRLQRLPALPRREDRASRTGRTTCWRRSGARRW